MAILAESEEKEKCALVTFAIGCFVSERLAPILAKIWKDRAEAQHSPMAAKDLQMYTWRF